MSAGLPPSPPGSPASPVVPISLACEAMGTRFELVLVGKADRSDETQLRAAGEVALEEIEDAHRRFTLHERDSLLAHLNRNAARDWVRLDQESFELLALADTVWRQSQGAFDPTVSPWMAGIGLHPGRSKRGEHDPVGWQHVWLDPEKRRVRFARAGVAIDLGGIAKGHGLDLGACALREAGVQNAILHGGTSSTVAIGAPPGLDGWRLALGEDSSAPTILLRDETLSAAAPRGRKVAGHGHIIDPERRISAARVRTAAVVAPLQVTPTPGLDPMSDEALEGRWPASWADAWSTALVVAPDLPLPSRLAGVLELPDLDGASRWETCQGEGSPFELGSPNLPSSP